MSSEVTASESIASVIPPIPTVTATGEAAVLDNEQQQQQHGAEEEHEHEHEHDDEEAEEEDGDDDFHAGAAELGVDQIESACMNCGHSGMTRLLVHKVPYFRELIIASFCCDNCGERNNDVTFGGEIQPQGCIYEFNCVDSRDLNRQVIKSDSCSVTVPEIEFEIPAGTQKGEITTIEGMLRQAARNLGLYQSERYEQMPEVAAKVEEIICALNDMASGLRLPFHVVLNDIAGNSFLENPYAPVADRNMKISSFTRTREQNEALGLRHETATYHGPDNNYTALLNKAHETGESGSSATSSSAAETPASEPYKLEKHVALVEDDDTVHIGRNEPLRLPAPCPSCGALGEALTAVTDIPHFKEVIIMAFSCSSCGFKDSEIKAGGAIPTLGTSVTLHVSCADDMKRDVLKSDSAMVIIPEVELELQHGTLGGLYTTVEGLIKKITAQLEENNPFYTGDSSKLHHFTGSTTITNTAIPEDAEDGESDNIQPYDITSSTARYRAFLKKMNEMADGLAFPFTLTVRDPLGNSFISTVPGTTIPPELDCALKFEDFERTHDENEDFGLNDIDTMDEEYYPKEQKILPDRLTHVYQRKPDHPTVFAKGCSDATEGGFVAASTEIASEHHHSAQEQLSSTWKADTHEATSIPRPMAASSGSSTTTQEGEDEEGDAEYLTTVRKRQFSDDSFIDFLPYEEFSGEKGGFVFRLGSKGLGYYKDVRKITVNLDTI